jgi:DNA polymerase
MAVKYSPSLNQSILPCRKKCKACGLYLNQLPLFDNYKQSQIFWLGLSAVQVDDVKTTTPLSSETASGNLISMIEKPYLRRLRFYKTNLVKCLPLKNERIRYPIQNEMEKCFPNFESEIKELKPTIVFLLGKQVSNFIAKKYSIKLGTLSKNFKYESFVVNGITFIPIHHPSYMLVYKRKHLKKYISQIQFLFSFHAIKFSTRKIKVA